MDEQKLIHDPPQKVLALYQAVIEFINEGCDINTLKVADITGRAGIGKGTAYEYFSSKEEIISSAILYYVKVCFEKLQVISTDNRTFQQKINEVMDFIDEHVKEKQPAAHGRRSSAGRVPAARDTAPDSCSLPAACP